MDRLRVSIPYLESHDRGADRTLYDVIIAPEKSSKYKNVHVLVISTDVISMPKGVLQKH
jgi:hypothetical protein